MYEYALTDKIKSPACVCDVDFGRDRSIILRSRHEGLDRLIKDGFVEVHQLDGRGRRVGAPIVGTIATNPAPLPTVSSQSVIADSGLQNEVKTDPLQEYDPIEREEILKALELVRNKPKS